MNESFFEDRYGFFLEWEERHSFFSWRIADVYIWGYIRRRIWEMICEHKGIIHCAYHIKAYDSNLNASVKNLYHYGGYKMLRRSDMVFVNMNRRYLVDDIFYSPYLDGLVQGLNCRYQVFDWFTGSLSDSCIVTPNRVKYDPYKMSAKWSRNQKITNYAIRLCDLIEKDFGINIGDDERSVIIDMINSIIFNRRWFMTFYTDALKRIKPKVVVVISINRQETGYIVEAAKKLGIITICLEHYYGLGGNIDCFYPRRMRLSFYSDYIWSYGESAKRYGCYDYCPLPLNRIIPIGNAYTEMRVKSKKQSKEYGKIAEDGKRHIAVLSDYSVRSGLSLFACELCKRIDPEKFKVHFKLHPGEERDWRENYPELIDSKVKIDSEDKNGDIFDYLCDKYCVIGTQSTALKEAIEMDKKVFIYDKTGLNSFVESVIIRSEEATVVKTVDDLISNIDCAEEYIPQIYPYSRNAVFNANDFIDSIILNHRRL